MRYRFLSLIVVILISTVVLSSCSYSPRNADIVPGIGDAQKGGTIRISSEHPDSLNPLKTQIQSNYNMLMLVFEGLFMVQNDQRVVPVLAEGYTVSDDGLEYVIELKKNIRFHDGKVLTSKDVVYTMNNIDKYCPKYNAVFDNIDMFYSLGNDKVVIKLIKPVMNFVSSLSFPVLSELTALSSFDSFDTKVFPVGTGEFMFDGDITRKELILKRNPSWHKKTGYIDTVHVLFVDSVQSATHSFNANLVDIITTNEYRWGDFSLTENYKTYEYENNVYGYIGINSERAVFSGANVKKAIYTAINREHIAEEVLKSHAEPAYVPVQKGSYFYPETPIDKVDDKEIIKSLLDSDGWVDVDADDVYEKKVGDDNFKLSFNMIVNADDNTALSVAESIAGSFAEYKMYAEIIPLNSKEYEEAYSKGDYDLILAKTYMDTGSFLKNMPGKLTEDMTKQLDKMCYCKTEEEFKKEIDTLCKMFLVEYPHIPLYFETSALFCKKNVNGTPSPSHSWVYNGITDLFVRTKEGIND